ncbi:MAG: alpha-galactosidase [Chitinophagaceae bacterium]
MKIYCTILFFFSITFCFAQTIPIETKNCQLVLSVGKNQKLYQSYLGKKLIGGVKELLPGKHEAYIPSGTDNLFEPAIRITHSDGNPSLELLFVREETIKTDDNVSTTIIYLKDPKYPVEVSLHFITYENEDIISTFTEIKHAEKTPIVLSNYASSMLHFDSEKYWLTQFYGDWAEEMRMEESKLTHGIKILDSKLGTRANMYQTPAFFLSLNNPSTETKGELIAGTLGWTGNFQFDFEIDEQNSLRVISGINPFASAYQLEPGKVFTTPEFIFTYSDQGKGQASRNFHRWATNYGILDGKKDRLTLLNNWEATQFNFDEAKLSGIFDEAAKLGVDLFLLDDGWFANKYPRNNDRAGLGDWEENTKKLPNGIAHLVKDAESKKVKFGIWLEPEMVNPKSQLYEKHPDWILKLPNRDEHYYRNQLVLDLVNPAVQNFVYNIVDELLTNNPGVAYIKWDCNRMMTNTYSPYLKDKQSQVFIDYTRAFYSIMERLRKKYPHLPIMLCSGGGGRTDYGALKYFTEFWPSDNTDGVERVFIQWGYSYFFPAFAISSHVTSWGKQSLKFRTDVAMMGKLGYDIEVSKMTEKDVAFSQQAVKNYKRLQEVIWHGDQYRLISPHEETRAVTMVVDSSKNKALLFSYNLNMRYGSNLNVVKLEGLDPNKKYTVQEINLYPGTFSRIAQNQKVYSGEVLMNKGLTVSSNASLTSAILEITAE